MMLMGLKTYLGIPEVGLIDHQGLIPNLGGPIGIILGKELKEISIMLISRSQKNSKNNKKT